MSALPEFTPPDRLLARWVRAVRDALVASETVRVVRRYDGDDVPIDVATGRATKPTTVLCIAATKTARSTVEVESGARVAWEWLGGADGLVRINAVDLTSATAEYDITIEVR
jgi:hypothetical protein